MIPKEEFFLIQDALHVISGYLMDPNGPTSFHISWTTNFNGTGNLEAAFCGDKVEIRAEGFSVAECCQQIATGLSGFKAKGAEKNG